MRSDERGGGSDEALRRAPVALYRLNLQSGGATLSERAAALLGYPDAASAPPDALRSTHPDDAAAIEGHVARIAGLADGETATVECRLRSGEGWIRVRLEDAPLDRDDQGVRTVIGVLTPLPDGGDGADDTWALAQSIAGVGAFEFRPEIDGAIGSDGYFMLFGIPTPPDRLHRSQAFFASLHPDDRDIVAQAMAHASVGSYRAEYRIVSPEGRVRWVRACAEQTGDAGRVIGALVDMTDTKTIERAILDTANFWRAVIDGQPAFLAVLDLSGAVVEANQPALERAGLERSETIGRRFSECGWWVWSAQTRAELDAALDTARGGDVVRLETGLLTAAGRVAPIDLTLAPLRNSAGAVTHVVASGLDVADRVAAEASLRDGLAELQSIYNTAPIGLCVIDSDLRWVRINERLAEINGFSPEAHIGRHIGELLPGLPEAEAVIRDVLETGRTLLDVEIEGETPAKPGVRRFWKENFHPLRDAAGRVRSVSVVCEEITEQKQSEERQRLLVRELGHRVKNTLALVQAITRQTAREARSVDDYEQALSGRLRALSAAHDLVFESDWQGADLERVIERALGGHTPLERIDLQVNGARVPTEMAQNLALAFHELTTNAMKYGALSTADGRVGIVGTVRDGTLDLTWIERGGPRVAPPKVQGFGATLLSRVLVYEHGGDVNLDWRPEGLVVRIRLPLSASPLEL